MRKSLWLAVLIGIAFLSNAQKYQLNVQAGGNTSFISKFYNEYVYIEGTSPFDFFYEFNSDNRGLYGSYGFDDIKVKNKAGFFFDAQVERKLANHWGISASLGLNQINYTYETPLAQKNLFNEPINNAIRDFGDTRLLYLTSRLANVSKKWGRFTLAAGPELNLLLKRNYTKTVVSQVTKGDKTMKAVFTELRGDATWFLFGANLNMKYDISKGFYITLGGQKIFSSLYEKEGTAADVHKKSRPLQAEIGVGYRIAEF
ncbi:MAG: hypothetical protein QM727_05145 [Niabella sp.]